MNKKGLNVLSIIIFLVIITITVLFFAGFQYGINELDDSFQGTNLIVGNDTNITRAAEQTFGVLNTGLTGLRWVAFAIFVAMALSIFISNFLVKAHPVFFIIYICITILAVVLSIPISNTYEDLLTSGTLSTTLMTYGPINYMMIHLPVFVTIIGLAGAIFLFIGVTVDRETGGSII